MFKYIFFDLDGTLTDSAEGITKCVQYALESRGIKVPDLNTLRPFIGPPLIESFMKFYGMTEEDARALLVSGFADNVSKELPVEYAVEMNNLIRLEMKGSIG